MKTLLLNFFRVLRPKLTGASILMYHSVADNGAFFTVRPDEFAWQLEYLKINKYEVVKLEDLIEKLKLGHSVKNNVVLTFDDGYKDNYTTVFPLLKKYNFPATIFMPTGLIGKTYTNSEGIILPLMSESELREMRASDLIGIMPHTETHAVLTEIDSTKIAEEIDRSRQTLEKLSGVPARIFSYPRGRYNSDVIKIVEERGIKAAVTVEGGIVRSAADPFRLKRNSVDSSTGREEFKAKVSDAIDLYCRLKKIFLR